MAGHSRSKNGVLSHAYAPAIREERDQTRFTGPRTGSAGDGPILFHGPDPQCSTVASVFAPRTTIDPDGTVEGYASLFGEIDHARDMVMRGAFADTLASRGIRRIPMLFQHDPSEPVGIWLELREDFRGAGARVRAVKHATSKAKLSCACTRAERKWVKTTVAPRWP